MYPWVFYVKTFRDFSANLIFWWHCVCENSLACFNWNPLFELELQPSTYASFVSRFKKVWGSGCGSVGRAVASDDRGPRFETSFRQTFIKNIYLFTVDCIKKTKIKKKRPGMAHFKKKKFVPEGFLFLSWKLASCGFWCLNQPRVKIVRVSY